MNQESPIEKRVALIGFLLIMALVAHIHFSGPSSPPTRPAVMTVHSLRLGPGEDLKERLTAIARERGLDAGFVVTCVGSLTKASIRFAGRPEYSVLEGPLEIVGLVGTFGPDGAHLHITVGDRDGRTTSGHLGQGAIVRTTAEVVLGDDPAKVYRRRPDAATGYHELAIENRVPDPKTDSGAPKRTP